MRETKMRCTLYVVIAIILIIIVAIFSIEPQLKMKIIYQFGLDTTSTSSVSFDLGNGFSEEDTINSKVNAQSTYEGRLYEMEFNIPPEYYLAKGMKIIPQNATESRIRCIEFYNNMTQIRRFDIYELTKYFETTKTVHIESQCYVLEAAGEIPSMIANDKFMEEYHDFYKQTNRVKYNLYLCIILILTLVIIIDINQLEKKKITKENNTKWDYLEMGWVVLILFLITIMALNSKLYEHPDENVTRMAIDYYLGGFKTPHLLSNWTAGTFSEYGATRLNEATWYYFVAGKIGWIFERITGMITYYRMPNLLLFSIMVIMYLKGRKNNPWMIICFLFTPQLWYIFSYATSDAWDFFWSFIVIYQLADKKSILNRYLSIDRKSVSTSLFLVSAIFAFVFQGKLNYYIILLLSFIILLFRIFDLQKKTRKMYLLKCILIVVISIGLAKGKEIVMNAPMQSSVTLEERKLIYQKYGREETKEVKANGDLSIQKLYKQNVPLAKLFTEMQMGKKLFSSFIGGYGWMTIFAGVKYQNFMGVLYFTFMAFLLWKIFQEKKGRERVELVLLLALNILIVASITYQCWFIDFQPQGRYMLPSVLILAYVTSRIKNIFKSKYFKMIMSLLAILSTYSYIFIAMKNLLVTT